MANLPHGGRFALRNSLKEGTAVMALPKDPNLDSAKPTPQPDPSGAVTPPNPTTTSAKDARTYGATTPPPEDQTPPKEPPASSGEEGTMRVVIERDYWPKRQPRERSDEFGRSVETRYRAGEVHSLPADEAMDLIEIGAAKRQKGG